jgi:hypothetical protein
MWPRRGATGGMKQRLLPFSARARFEATIDPNRFLWGRTYYPTGQPVLDQAGRQVR